MKKLFFITFVVFFVTYFYSFVNAQETVKKVNPTKKVKTLKQGEYLSPVDTSKIRTFDDYENLKFSLWEEYETIRIRAWEKYESNRLIAYQYYCAKKDSAIRRIRDAHYELYLSWLDAKNLNEYEKVRQIENRLEFKPLMIAENWYDIYYTKADEEGFLLYEKIDEEVFAEYEKKDNYAYSVFEIRNKK